MFDDLLAGLQHSPALVAHYRQTYCPNESIFHTLLLPRVPRNGGHNLHYVRFVGDRPHPELMTQADWDDLVKSRAFFARKFDPHDVALLNRVDQILLTAC